MPATSSLSAATMNKFRVIVGYDFGLLDRDNTEAPTRTSVFLFLRGR